MRGARLATSESLASHRIIPAYAGSTIDWEVDPAVPRDHPRVCGEHRWRTATSSRAVGSSPRMRGALCFPLLPPEQRGIIPAYAGSTAQTTTTSPGRGDHPRVCGEHYADAIGLPSRLGSSPRMRGALIVQRLVGDVDGIIPAYAGSTCGRRSRREPGRDHPRVCGEHT